MVINSTSSWNKVVLAWAHSSNSLFELYNFAKVVLLVQNWINVLHLPRQNCISSVRPQRFLASAFFVSAEISLAIDDFGDVGVRRLHLLGNDWGDLLDCHFVVLVLALNYVLASHVPVVVFKPSAQSYNWFVELGWCHIVLANRVVVGFTELFSESHFAFWSISNLFVSI